MTNALRAIYPYRSEGLWVFDDEDAGLRQEPFVSGADTFIDRAVQARDIASAERGFRLLFSAGPFPGCHYRLRWLREDDGGNWYHSDDFGLEAWLCPALFRYFEQAPQELYARFESR